ncbi:unnamed protein product, partial [Prorocentrum cordatum]
EAALPLRSERPGRGGRGAAARAGGPRGRPAAAGVLRGPSPRPEAAPPLRSEGAGGRADLRAPGSLPAARLCEGVRPALSERAAGGWRYSPARAWTAGRAKSPRRASPGGRRGAPGRGQRRPRVAAGRERRGTRGGGRAGRVLGGAAVPRQGGAGLVAPAEAAAYCGLGGRAGGGAAHRGSRPWSGGAQRAAVGPGAGPARARRRPLLALVAEAPGTRGVPEPRCEAAGAVRREAAAPREGEQLPRLPVGRATAGALLLAPHGAADAGGGP